jgi:hypothetical protein
MTTAHLYSVAAQADEGPDARGRRIAERLGYTDYVYFPDGFDACISRRLFGYAILGGITPFGHDKRWPFRTYKAAKAALDAWAARGGIGEPSRPPVAAVTEIADVDNSFYVK